MTVKDFDSTTRFAAAYRPHPGSCLILDHHLPGESGLDYLASLGKEGPGLPVIMVTGRADEASRARAFQLGAFAFLDKPVDNRELLSAISRAVGS